MCCACRLSCPFSFLDQIGLTLHSMRWRDISCVLSLNNQSTVSCHCYHLQLCKQGRNCSKSVEKIKLLPVTGSIRKHLKIYNKKVQKIILVFNALFQGISIPITIPELRALEIPMGRGVSKATFSNWNFEQAGGEGSNPNKTLPWRLGDRCVHFPIKHNTGSGYR